MSLNIACDALNTNNLPPSKACAKFIPTDHEPRELA